VARAAWPDVTTVEDIQLQIEQALDLDGARGLCSSSTPGRMRLRLSIGPERGESHTTHALAPEAVLDVYARSLRRPPPPAFTLCMRGERFRTGRGPVDRGEREAGGRLGVRSGPNGRAVGRGLAAQGQRAGAMTDFQIRRNEFQTSRNEIQAGRNNSQIRRNGIQMHYLYLSTAYASIGRH
jgi:hypothetical protein